MQEPEAVEAVDGRLGHLGLTAGRRIRRRRRQLGWSQPALAYHMATVGARYRGTPQQASLVSMISKWEGDRIEPDEYNRRLLAEAMAVTVADLGMTEDPDFVMTAESGVLRENSE